MLNTISSETYVFLGFNGIHVSFLMNLKFNKINASEIYICICIRFMCVLRRAEPWIYAPTFQYKFKLMKLLSRVSNSHKHTHTICSVLFCSRMNVFLLLLAKERFNDRINSYYIPYFWVGWGMERGYEEFAQIFCMIWSEVEAHALNQFICRECKMRAFLGWALVINNLSAFYCCFAGAVVVIFECLRGFDLHHDLEPNNHLISFSCLCSTFLRISSIKKETATEKKKEKRREERRTMIWIELSWI